MLTCRAECTRRPTSAGTSLTPRTHRTNGAQHPLKHFQLRALTDPHHTRTRSARCTLRSSLHRRVLSPTVAVGSGAARCWARASQAAPTHITHYATHSAQAPRKQGPGLTWSLETRRPHRSCGQRARASVEAPTHIRFTYQVHTPHTQHANRGRRTLDTHVRPPP